MIRMIEKVIDATRTKDGGLVVNGDNEPMVFCCIARKQWNRRYNNIEEVIIKPSNVSSAMASMYNAGICVNIIS